MKTIRGRALILAFLCLTLSACNDAKVKPRGVAPKITITTVQSKPVTLTQRYICQIQSHHHIKIRALEIGFLDAVKVKEGQFVKKGDALFQVNYKRLFENKLVTGADVSLRDPVVEKARANVDTSALALGLSTVQAPFDGRVDRITHEQGSLVQKGDTLTTLSDNSMMWVYFNVPEATYLDLQSAKVLDHKEQVVVELELVDGKKFPTPGKLSAIEADFNHETGNIAFRADFPNPELQLRHGQAGTVILKLVENDAIVVPQRATFEVGLKRYVYVIDENDVAHQREISIQSETDDLFIIRSGVAVDEKIVVEGIREVNDGDKVDYDGREPKKVLASVR